MTAACGLARNYAQFFLARIGVGVGEATLGPGALSLLSDYFPREKRSQPIAFYNMGVSLGAAIAFIFGGLVIGYIFDPSVEPTVLPIVGELRPWQTVFVIVGLPGLLIAALMMTVKEPSRKDKIQLAGQDVDVIPIKDVIGFLTERWRTYITLFLGMSVVTILGYVYFSWLPTCFVRTWGWDIPKVGLTYGIVMLICGPLGRQLGRLARRFHVQKGSQRCPYARCSDAGCGPDGTLWRADTVDADTGIGRCLIGALFHRRGRRHRSGRRSTDDDCPQPNARANLRCLLFRPEHFWPDHRPNRCGFGYRPDLWRRAGVTLFHRLGVRCRRGHRRGLFDLQFKTLCSKPGGSRGLDQGGAKIHNCMRLSPDNGALALRQD